jgi:hypothetical protein
VIHILPLTATSQEGTGRSHSQGSGDYAGVFAGCLLKESRCAQVLSLHEAVL